MLSLYQPDTSSDEYKIFAYIKGFPVDLSAVLVAVHICSMLGYTFILAVHPAWIRLFVCSGESLFGGKLWQFFTYPFFHNIAAEHIWFVVSMAMLIWFGRPIESTIGTLSFGLMYTACAIIPVFLLILLSPVLPVAVFDGSRTLHFAIFIGFAMLFPHALIFAIIQAKWIAIIFLAIDTLACFAKHDLITLLHLWLSVSVIYGYLRYIHGQGILRRFMDRIRQRQRLRLYKPEPSRRARDDTENEQIMDSLLRKISQQGIDSLTPKEKRRLEDARRKMIDKQNRR